MLLFCCLAAALAQAPAAPSPAALRVVVRSEFQFLGSTRSSESEFRAKGDKLWRKRGEQIAPVPWPAPAATVRASEDLHTAGFDYTPEFFWKMTDTEETRAIQGRSCRLSTATGTAAYAQTELRLWFCPGSRDESSAGALVADGAGGPYRGIAAFVLAEAARRPASVLFAFEETTEPAIAPSMVRKTEVTVLEPAAEPAAQ